MWGFVLLYVLLVPSVALYLREKHTLRSDAPRTVALKAACTTMIVLAAVVETAGAPEQIRLYAVLIAAGLVLGLVGDVVICQKAPGGFLSGMIYFALGHLCYISGFLRVSKHLVWAVPVFLVIYVLVVFAACKLRAGLGKLFVPVLIYSAVIAAMVSLSVTMPFSVKYGCVQFLGAVLFAISDAILALGITSGTNTAKLGLCLNNGTYKNANHFLVDSFGLYCYFIGQSLFAVSIYCLR